MKNLRRRDKNIYFKLLDILEIRPRSRKELIDSYISSLGLTKEELSDRSTAGKVNIYRSTAGSAIDEMTSKGIIIRSTEGIYTATEQKPVVIRNERCEKLILKLLADHPMTKNMLRDELVRAFGTDKTLTERDDNKLFTVLGEILRRLVRDGIIHLEDKLYSLSGKIEARLDDIDGMLTLRETFLSGLYKRGGEFFEIYFMSLLERYVAKNGKKVTSATVTGGSDDGGIDGIMTTEDCLGFRETTMVQTKNRSDLITETDVRGFYGAVCAKQGSRGIFATTSSFHYSAKQFIDGIDNCVGITGEDIFKMALTTGYGIKKSSTGYSVDEKII